MRDVQRVCGGLAEPEHPERHQTERRHFAEDRQRAEGDLLAEQDLPDEDGHHRFGDRQRRKRVVTGGHRIDRVAAGENDRADLSG